MTFIDQRLCLILISGWHRCTSCPTAKLHGSKDEGDCRSHTHNFIVRSGGERRNTGVAQARASADRSPSAASRPLHRSDHQVAEQRPQGGERRNTGVAQARASADRSPSAASRPLQRSDHQVAEQRPQGGERRNTGVAQARASADRSPSAASRPSRRSDHQATELHGLDGREAFARPQSLWQSQAFPMMDCGKRRLLFRRIGRLC
jgi:hypothetical protein